ncbi:hypothetical protein [Paraburkholderia sediminicola]|uniref:hypothetical protein n=1 Tax=Paraburkholderia sediminicola TaxID=458836 RepID=UPI0038B92ABB
MHEPHGVEPPAKTGLMVNDKTSESRVSIVARVAVGLRHPCSLQAIRLRLGHRSGRLRGLRIRAIAACFERTSPGKSEHAGFVGYGHAYCGSRRSVACVDLCVIQFGFAGRGCCIWRCSRDVEL